MWKRVFCFIIYGSLFVSLFAFDAILGNGCVELFQKWFCKMICLIRKVLKEEMSKQALESDGPVINIPLLLFEVIVLASCMAILSNYKQFRGKDRIDELLLESKNALRQSNDFLDKWRQQRLPTEYSYLDDEPQDIKPLKLEVPILHMAIIDTRGTSRSQPESGDAGDAINIQDSTLLSVTSLLDDELESMPDIPINDDAVDKKEHGDTPTVDFKNRYLWDVIEEDMDLVDD